MLRAFLKFGILIQSKAAYCSIFNPIAYDALNLFNINFINTSKIFKAFKLFDTSSLFIYHESL